MCGNGEWIKRELRKILSLDNIIVNILLSVAFTVVTFSILNLYILNLKMLDTLIIIVFILMLLTPLFNRFELNNPPIDQKQDCKYVYKISKDWGPGYTPVRKIIININNKSNRMLKIKYGRICGTITKPKICDKTITWSICKCFANETTNIILHVCGCDIDKSCVTFNVDENTYSDFKIKQIYPPTNGLSLKQRVLSLLSRNTVALSFRSLFLIFLLLAVLFFNPPVHVVTNPSIVEGCILASDNITTNTTTKVVSINNLGVNLTNVSHTNNVSINKNGLYNTNRSQSDEEILSGSFKTFTINITATNETYPGEYQGFIEMRAKASRTWPFNPKEEDLQLPMKIKVADPSKSASNEAANTRHINISGAYKGSIAIEEK